MINWQRFKQFRVWSVLNFIGIAEKPILPWWYYITHNEQDIQKKEEIAHKRCAKLLKDI